MTASHDTPGARAGHTLFVCSTCRRGAEPLDPPEERSGFRLARSVAEAALAAGGDIAVVPVECLSNCSKGCTAAFAGPGKWTYIIGDLDPAEHIADILAFARQHAAHPEGVPVWRERPAHIRRNVVARVPPLTPPVTTAEQDTP